MYKVLRIDSDLDGFKLVSAVGASSAPRLFRQIPAEFGRTGLLS